MERYQVWATIEKHRYDELYSNAKAELGISFVLVLYTPIFPLH